MSKKEKNKSIKGEYNKIRVSGWRNPYGKNPDAVVSISLHELTYDGGTSADVSFTIKEAKEIIGLIEAAIKEANKKEKN